VGSGEWNGEFCGTGVNRPTVTLRGPESARKFPGLPVPACVFDKWVLDCPVPKYAYLGARSLPKKYGYEVAATNGSAVGGVFVAKIPKISF
jgi:hypothetical protein